MSNDTALHRQKTAALALGLTLAALELTGCTANPDFPLGIPEGYRGCSIMDASDCRVPVQRAPQSWP